MDLLRITAALGGLKPAVREYVLEKAKLCQPSHIVICDGSDEENAKFLKQLEDEGVALELKKWKNCWLVETDPQDVARVESKTVIVTPDVIDTIPVPKSGFKPSSEANLPNMKLSLLGNWMAPEEFEKEVQRRFPGCMKGRTMYVVPYSMGPINGPISKIGFELTDSLYVVVSMRIMTRMGKAALEALGDRTDFVKSLHSVGVPLPTSRVISHNWPCNPEMTMIAHVPAQNEIYSFGSGYGGNSLLGKKCFALRLGSKIAQREGWLAEHMLISGVTDPEGNKKYIAAAFPSQCGKTNLAMLTSPVPGWKVECVGDDIAWMKFNPQGDLRAINPEYGIFGVCPGTSMKTNPNAMKAIHANTIFTNVALTDDGDVYWEGIDDEELKKHRIVSWKGNEWSDKSKELAAHPNSRFCAPAKQIPIIDPSWEDPEGVPVSAIIFGGRRPVGVPLVYEAFDWNHGVFIGASVRSETTAAAEHKGKAIMHDPFAMRPFFGYNFGQYCGHWLSLNQPGRKMPRIFHVNWFRRADNGNGKFLWPGFGENVRVLEWIFKRLAGVEGIAEETPIGWVPKLDSLDLTGLDVSEADMKELLSVDPAFFKQEAKEIRAYFDENVNESMPREIYDELDKLEARL